jgi:glycosyltransferase involved in cell wall biosynthesis
MMQEKKVLFILHTPPPIHGSSMIGQFIKDSDLINNSFNTQYINLGTSKSIDEIGKKPIRKIFSYLSIIYKTFIQLIFNRPNIVYLAITAKGLGFYKDVPIALLVKCFRVPLALHFHNKGIVTRQDRKFDDFLYRIVFKNTKVILLSKYLYYDVQKYVSEQNLYFCANGIPLINDESSSNRENNKTPKLLFLSNLIETKGVFVLLEALKILKEKGISFKCDFVGGEGDVTRIDFQAKVKELHLEEKVFYLGKKYNLEKVAIFKESDIFVLPTFYSNECFPLVLLEALQFGLPMVSTYEGAIPEIVEEGVNGFLVKQQDIVGLADKLEELIEDKILRKHMGQAAKEKYIQKYTLDQFDKTLLNIIISII